MQKKIIANRLIYNRLATLGYGYRLLILNKFTNNKYRVINFHILYTTVHCVYRSVFYEAMVIINNNNNNNFIETRLQDTIGK